MTADFINMMHLFSCGALNKEPDEGREYNISAILKLAVEQSVFPFVFLSLKRLCEKNTGLIGNEEYQLVQKQYMRAVYAGMRRNAAVHSVVSYLEKNNVKCCMLKGQILAQLYAVPEARLSGDADILLDSPDDEMKVCSLLKEKGFDIIERPHTSHHAMCTSEATGLMEFHLSLYDELYEDVWFENAAFCKEDLITVTLQDGYTCKTLGITDGAIFVTLHAIKHFLSEGVGVRQLTDFILYNEKYKEELDWDRYNTLMKKLKFDEFIKYCYTIGSRYLGLECKSYDVDEECMNKILSDIEAGGVFGAYDKTRKGFYIDSTRERYGKNSNADYDKYLKEWRGSVSIGQKWFPGYDEMCKTYKRLKSKKYLLPVFWVSRLFNILKRKLFKPNKATSDSRIELLRKLGII